LLFLIDASLPRNVAKLILIHGHEPVDVRDVDLRHADDSIIAAHAKSHQMALISGDFDFADIRIYSPSSYFGLVIIDRPEDATIAEVLELMERFFAHRDLLEQLTSRSSVHSRND
jgi:predicted nuclease of predicted toxin-antitoxin system